MTRPGRTIAFAGDVMLGRTVASHLAAHGRMAVWKDVLPTLWGPTSCSRTWNAPSARSSAEWRDGERKAFYFRAQPSAVEALTAAGIDFVSLANNHVLDFGVPGLRETIAVLDRAGIAHAGAGLDLRAATRPARLQADGMNVAVVACADHPDEWAATADRPGIRLIHAGSESDLERVAISLAEAREGADLVVISLHWGPNMRDRPSEEFRAFARASTRARTSCGDTAHVVQGIEARADRPVRHGRARRRLRGRSVRNDLGALFLVHARGRDRRVALVRCASRQRTGRATGKVVVARADTSLCAERATVEEVEIGSSPPDLEGAAGYRRLRSARRRRATRVSRSAAIPSEIPAMTSGTRSVPVTSARTPATIAPSG
jgi:poly-gamma-glutamate synthesis protein (capsule biosynthesis protein)